MPSTLHLAEFPSVVVVHPCSAFAQQAGHESWLAALSAMRGGAIISGYMPKVGRSTFDLFLFLTQIKSDGLLLVFVPHSDLGLVSLGFREHFPAKTLARIDAEEKPIAGLPLGQYKCWHPPVGQ